MGNFRQGNDRGFSRGGGNRFGGRGGGRGGFGGGRSFGGRDSGRSMEMHDATCSKCGKHCQVPFKPTGSKPVYCSDCFRQTEGGSSSAPRSFERPAQSPGVSSEQFNQINAKLDKILAVLNELEIDVVEEDGEEDEEGDEDLEDEETEA